VENMVSKKPLLILFVIWTMLVTASAQLQSAQPEAQPAVTPITPTSPALEDGTPVQLRMGQTVSSADAHVGDSIVLEVLEEVRVGNVVVVAKGGTAIATVTTAQSKKNMGRGGKLDINVDYVKLADGERAALRAVKDVKGGGHTGAMTGAIVATSLVFFPAAPLFLFMKGKDITIPKGTEVTAFVSGNMSLKMAKFQGLDEGPTVASLNSGAITELALSSTPTGAEITVDEHFVGNTPSSVNLMPGEHTVLIRIAGFQSWNRNIRTSGGRVNLSATLVKSDGGDATSAALESTTSLADAARAAKAKRPLQGVQNAPPEN
jgi:antitoxin (DNA-binding transcriptional repressor) of toxin-antitoxin stability system